MSDIKNPIVAEMNHNSAMIQNEERYTEFRDALGKSLQKIIALKSAISNYELKLVRAKAEFEQELITIQENYK